MTFLQWLEAALKWMSLNQMTVLWIIIGVAVVVYGVWWTAKKARGGLVEWARLVLQSTWGVVFMLLFPLFSCILIVAIAMLTDLVPWTFQRIDNIVNDRPFFSQPVQKQGTTNNSAASASTEEPADDAVPAATQAIETFTTGGAYVVSLPSGATVRNACSSTATELGTIPTGSTVTLSTPVDSNCVDNANGDSVCQRATITAVDPLPSGFDPVGGCIHLAAVSPK